MTIEEAIEIRLKRFDNLYEKATGHTFREDEAYCSGLNAEIIEKRNEELEPVLKKHNIGSIDEYISNYFKNDKKIDEIENILKKKEFTTHTSLYPYEMYCLNECAKLVHFIESKGEGYWKSILEKGNSLVDIVRSLEDDGFEFSKDHSGNTMGSTITFTNCFIWNPELFQYMHGALAGLVGDEGYHDDRSDLPEVSTKKDKEEE